MSLIKNFLELVDDKSENITIDSLFTGEAEKSIYEKWIKIFTEMKPMAIVPMLTQIDETYKMSKEEELIILAYVKYFEINILKEIGENYKAYYEKILYLLYKILRKI